MFKMFLTEHITTENITAAEDNVYQIESKAVTDSETKFGGVDANEEMEISNRSGTMLDPKSEISNLNKTSHGTQWDLYEDYLHRSDMSHGKGSTLDGIYVEHEQLKRVELENASVSFNSTSLSVNGSLVTNWPLFESDQLNDVKLTDTINIDKSLFVNRTRLAKTHSQSNQEVKVEFLRANYAQFLKMILTSENVQSREILPRPAEVSETCYSHMMDWFDSLAGQLDDHNRINNRSFMWALKMFDSFGRPSAGLITGALQLEGDYDQCLDIKAKIPSGTRLIGDRVKTEPTHFGTRYCRVQLPVGQHYTLGLPVGHSLESSYITYPWSNTPH
ncbi:hypothetical protein Btru_011418 [Bulinus truncatus]|nr:hypothetical protein Btru_011418 [Bulinus truncatus]